MLRSAIRVCVLWCAGLAMSMASLLAQSGSGLVAGRVVDSVTGAPLVGADVLVKGSALRAATDRAGAFTLVGVPAGRHQVLVVYLGHVEQRAEVTVTAGQRVTLDVKMTPATFTDTAEVRAASGDGQARALNQQKTAPNITNVVSADQIGAFPDPNAAEAASRVPGVSIARDQGEGRYILIRGTEPRLNSVMIDGERIPAPEGDLRQVQLDAVPADQLQSIEVSKAVTPDMDGDSIGGAVNLVTKQAVSKPTLLFAAAGGYNALQRSSDQQQYSGTAGRRFSDGQVGLLAGFSVSKLTRGSENFEATYGAGALTDLQLRDYQIKRNRYGFNASMDARAGQASTFTFRGILNRFEDYEVNNRIRFRPTNRRIEHVLKNRHQSDDIRSASAGAQHVAGSGWLVDYRLAWAWSREEQPDRLDTVFRQTNINFTPNVSAASIDPENIQPNPSANNAATARLNNWSEQIFDTTNRDVTGTFNVRRALTLRNGRAGSVKAGVKYKDVRKDRAADTFTGTPTSTVLFPQLQDTAFDNSRFLDFFPAGYAPFPGIMADASRDMYNTLPSSAKVLDRATDAQDYVAKERVLAVYGMAELALSPKLTLLPGLRVERTRVDYSGFQVRYTSTGAYLSTSPVSGADNYTTLLPGFHLRYAVDADTNLRLAYTRTLARPNYSDLAPYEIVHTDSNSIERGNSALQPTTSENLDVLAERYFASVGMVSGGLFYKRLSAYIYPFRFTESAFGGVYQVTQPKNGDGATLWGLELAYQNRFRRLPAPFDGLSFYANYTWTDSSATFPDRTGSASLPGQSKHLGNIAVAWEKFGFDVKSSWNFHGKYIDAVGASAGDDVYYDNHVQWDVSVGQKLTKNLRLYADFLNLTNAPLRYYQGTTDRPIQQEYYRWWTMFGLKASW